MASEVSIAVSLPIHDWTPQLKAVLGSLKAQKANLQITVMMTKEDPRIQSDLETSGLSFHYTRIGPDAGQAAAIAEGWANTDSPIVAWLNTDDALVNDALTQITTMFKKNSNLDLVYGHSTVSDQTNTIRGYHPAVQPSQKLISRTNIISQPSCFCRRRAVDAIGGINTRLQYTMDWDLWLRLYENQAKFEFLDEILSNVTWSHGTKTAGLSKQRLIEFTKILRRSQSLYKTSLGLSALIRNNLSTYKSNKTIDSNCSPLTASAESTKIPILNMHSEPKRRLHIEHGSTPIKFGNLENSVDVETKSGKSILTFYTPVASGKSVLLNIEGENTLLKSFSWH